MVSPTLGLREVRKILVQFMEFGFHHWNPGSLRAAWDFFVCFKESVYLSLFIYLYIHLIIYLLIYLSIYLE